VTDPATTRPPRAPRGAAAPRRIKPSGSGLGDAGDDYLVFVRSSFAGYLADLLLDAALEYTVQP
jgi:sarcosine oxidase, subunit gamma